MIMSLWSLSGADPVCQLNVLLCQPSCVVAGQHKVNFVPPDVDIRVMIGLFGLFSGAVHEHHCGSEVLELEVRHDLIAVQPPIRQVLELPADLFGIE